MIKCPNCGVEIEDGSKFCGECGTAIPQSQECPQCHTKLAFGAKFCMECGYSFMGKQAGGVSIGDKNVIAGDVVGKKDTYHVSGNATIVKNEDESRKLVQCSICGKNMAISDSIKCKSCGEIVCEDCFNEEDQKCTKCVNASNDAAYNEYRDAVQRILKEGRIGLGDRKKLIALQKKIGLSASKAMQIESQLRPGADSRVVTESLRDFDRANRGKAFDAFYRKGDYKKTTEILEPFFSEDTDDEELIAMYVGALSKYNPPAARKVIAALKADVVSAYMANFDMAMKNGDLASAEKILNKAEGFWPNDYLIKCHRVVFLCAMGKVSGDENLMSEARDVRTSLSIATTPIEKSWEAYIDLLLEGHDSEESAVADKCQDGALLRDIVSQGLDKLGAMYCIVDISGGESAKKYPIYYMDTESIYDWSDEFKSRLLVLRKVNAGKYTMGHGEAEKFDINDEDESYEPKNPNPRHDVLLTSPYYIAVFPITNQQWWLMNGQPTKDDEDDEQNPLAPVDCLSYHKLRGSKIGVKWPILDGLDSDSFFYKFREKTGINTADLPTDAQWEVACRAGVDADFYSGKNITNDARATRDALSEIAVWGKSAGGETVGSCLPNNWGLYDCLGNVSEWCRDPNFELHPDHYGRYHIYTETAVDPTGCLYLLGKDDEIERKYRCVRGGIYWCEDPEEVTVWYQDNAYASGDNAGFRPVFTICDDNAVKKTLLQDDDFEVLAEDEKKKLQRLSAAGDYSARYLIARSAEVESRSAGMVMSEYEELAKLGFPAALRAMGRLCALRNTDEDKKLAIEYYKRAASLGDVASLRCYKSLADSDERMQCSVAAILDKYSSTFEEGWQVKCFSGSEAEKNADRFRAIISTAFSCPKDAISKNVYAAIAWKEEEIDEPGSANVDIIASDGIYIIQPWSSLRISGYISWIDFRNKASLKVIGTAKETRYLEFCKDVNILEGMVNPDGDGDDRGVKVSKALIAFYSDLRNVVNDLYTETGIKQRIKVSDLSKLSPAEFKERVEAVSNHDAPAHLSIARCFRDGVCTDVDVWEAIVHFQIAYRGGAAEALKEYRELITADEYILPMIRFAIATSARETEFDEKSLYVGNRKFDKARSIFAQLCTKYDVLEEGVKPELVSAFADIDGGDIESSNGVFFASDGVYVFNDRKDDRKYNGFIPWPDFNSHNEDDGSWYICFAGGSGIKYRYGGDDTRKLIRETLNKIAERTKEIYGKDSLAGVEWLKRHTGDNGIGSSEVSLLEKMSFLGCGPAGVALYKYFVAKDEKPRAIEELANAYASGCKDALDLCRTDFVFDASTKTTIASTLLKDTGGDESDIVLDKELSGSTLKSFRSRVARSHLELSNNVVPFVSFGDDLDEGEGFFFADNGIYIIAEEDASESNDYFIPWLYFLGGVELVGRKYSKKFRVACGNAVLVFESSNTPYRNEELLKLLQTTANMVRDHFISGSRCAIASAKPSDDLSPVQDEVDIRDTIGRHEVSMFISGQALGIGAEKMDDAESLEFCDISSYKDLDYYNASLVAPILDGATLVIVSTSKKGNKKEITYSLSSSDKASGIGYECEDGYCDDLSEQRDCTGDEICLCGQKKYMQRFEIEDNLDIDGVFDPHKLVIKYAKVKGAGGEVFSVVCGFEYDGDSVEIEPKGSGSSAEFTIWKETAKGSSMIDMSDIGEHTLTMSVSGAAFGIGVEKFDDAESLEYLDMSSYKELDYYDESVFGPVLQGAKLSVVSTSKKGKKKETCYDLSASDTKSGIVYELDEDYCSDIDDARNCSGDEVCLCCQKKIRQSFETQYKLDTYGVFDPHKLVVKYANVKGAHGETFSVICEIEYDSDLVELEPKGGESSVAFEVWKESTRGVASIDLDSSLSDEDDVGKDSEDEHEQLVDESDNAPKCVRPQKNKGLNPAAIIAAVVAYFVMWIVPGFWITLLSMAVFVGLSIWMVGDAANKDHDGIMMTELLGAGIALVWFLWKMVVAFFN